jgi:hypothetical protein
MNKRSIRLLALATLVGFAPLVAHYMLKFDLGASTIHNSGGPGSASVIVAAQGTTAQTGTYTAAPVTSNDWTSETFTFIADSTSTTISFTGTTASARNTWASTTSFSRVACRPCPSRPAWQSCSSDWGWSAPPPGVAGRSKPSQRARSAPYPAGLSATIRLRPARLAWYSAASARCTSESSVSAAASSDTPPLNDIGITLSR